MYRLKMVNDQPNVKDYDLCKNGVRHLSVRISKSKDNRWFWSAFTTGVTARPTIPRFAICKLVQSEADKLNVIAIKRTLR